MTQPDNEEGPHVGEKHFSIEEMFHYLKANDTGLKDSSRHFGKYLIQRIISARTQSVVMLVFDPELRRQVIVKVYKPDLPKDLKETILNEGQSICQVNSPHVAKCHSVESISNCLCLILEYVPGPTLAQLQLPLESEAALEIILQISKGVSKVHERGLLHLDLKPSNIILSQEQTAFLIDFGLAQSMSNVKFGEISGTPEYMAPEVADHELRLIDRKTDVFGIGAVFYTLLTGQPLYKADTIEGLHLAAKASNITPPKDINPDVSELANELCMLCLQKNPSSRLSNAEEILAKLQIPNRPAKGSKKPIGLASPRWLKPALALLALVAIATAGWVAFSPGTTGIAGGVNTVLELCSEPPFRIDVNNRLDLQYSVNRQTAGQTQALTEFPAGELVAFDVSAKMPAVNLQLGKEVELTFTAKEDCWMALGSVEFNSSGDSKVLQAVAIDGNTTQHVRANEECTFTATMNAATPNDETEFFVLMAKNTEWDARKSLFDAVRDTQQELSVAVAQTYRGTGEISESNEGMIVIPYRVSANAGNSDTQTSFFEAEKATINGDLSQAKSHLEFVLRSSSKDNSQFDSKKLAFEHLADLEISHGAFGESIETRQQLIAHLETKPNAHLHAIRLQKASIIELQKIQNLTDTEKSNIAEAKSAEIKAEIHAKHCRFNEANSQFDMARNSYEEANIQKGLFENLMATKRIWSRLQYGGNPNTLPEIDNVESILAQHLGEDHEEIAKLDLARARFYEYQFKMQEFLECYQRYQNAISKSKFDYPDLHRIRAFCGLGYASPLTDGGSKKKSEEYFNSARNLIEQKYGKISFEMAKLDSYRLNTCMYYSDNKNGKYIGEQAMALLKELDPHSELATNEQIQRLRATILQRTGWLCFNTPVKPSGSELAHTREADSLASETKNREVGAEYLQDSKTILEDMNLEKTIRYVFVLRDLSQQLYVPLQQKSEFSVEDHASLKIALQYSESAISICKELTGTVRLGNDEEEDQFLQMLLKVKADAYVALGKSESAIKLFAQMKQSKNSDPVSQNSEANRLRSIAWAFLKNGEQQKAFDAFVKAIDLRLGIYAPTMRSESDYVDTINNGHNLRSLVRELVSVTKGDNPQQVATAFERLACTKGMVTQTQAKVKSPKPLRLDGGTIESLSSHLSDGTAVIEFFKVDRTAYIDKPYYVAFVIARTAGETKLNMVKLGSDTSIETPLESIKRSRFLKKSGEKDLASRGTGIGESSAKIDKNAMSKFRKLVWEKLAPLLSSSNMLVMCGDSYINKVAWSTVSINQHNDEILIDRFALSTSANSQELISALAKQPDGEGIAAVYGLDFGKAKQTKWAQLPQTLTEGKMICAAFEDNNLLAKHGNSTDKKGILKCLDKARIAYVATHGTVKSDAKTSDREIFPFIACRLILANANEATDVNDEEFFVSGQDIVSLNLENLDFVILSACDTAAGRYEYSGEGIMGMQRAFMVAGSKTCLASAWPVEDKHAHIFMRKFIAKSKTMNKAKALRESQIEMRNEKYPSRFWANWNLMGDWR